MPPAPNFPNGLPPFPSRPSGPPQNCGAGLRIQRKDSTLFSLLLAVAGDTAGAFVLLPAGQRPQPAPYESTRWAELAATVQAKSAAAIGLQAGEARISLAGAQDKAGIAILADGVPRLPRGTAPSTHILKPDIRRLNKVRESALNEAEVMLTAARCGLPTAEVFDEALTYDLMRTRIAPGLSREFAFSPGGETLPGRVGREQINALARELGMGAAFVHRTAAELGDRWPAALPRSAT